MALDSKDQTRQQDWKVSSCAGFAHLLYMILRLTRPTPARDLS